MCRLLDGQREGQLTQKLDIDTLNTKYLPEKLADLKNFIYNQQVKHELKTKKLMKKMVPNNGNANDYNKQIVVA